MPKTHETKMYFFVEDRKEAIVKAIKIASLGDMVLITGKGHETSMNYGFGEKAWSEYEVIKDALVEKNN
jgi:UDP-N-acetylmuramoyl-L-alanyl-D-glutamate--2,6-diaminopimelate ligase